MLRYQTMLYSTDKYFRLMYFSVFCYLLVFQPGVWCFAKKVPIRRELSCYLGLTACILKALILNYLVVLFIADCRNFCLILRG